ncbi:MAG: aspartate 1-decarboxylase [Nitrospirae bacterium]|nr:aspartate 1-decarboxylase [Nitrospirota bacterium]
MKSKIHKATVTEANLNHTDSITIDEDLMKMVNLKQYENVLVVNNTSGARLETFAEKGKRGSGIVSANGAASHLMKKGDEIIIMSFTWTNKKFIPKAILVDKENKFVEFLEGGVF